MKQPVFEVLRRNLRLPKRLTSHLRFRGPFTVEIDHAHQFRIEHWGFMVENDLFWSGFGNGYEGTSLEVWRRLAPHAQVIVDVGANTGIYTLVARCVNPTATIIALEPVERVFRRLERNIELNGGNVTIEKLAASDTTGKATFYDLSTYHELTASLDPAMSQGCVGIVEYAVATKRLEDVLSGAGLRGVDLIKIDVELAEPQVLLGLGAFLSNSKPAIVIEILNERIAREVSDITGGLGYKSFRIVERHGLVLTDCIEAADLKGRNYLLAQDEIVEAAKIAELVVQ